MAEYHQDEWAEHDANGRALMYPGPDGRTAYRNGREVGSSSDTEQEDTAMKYGFRFSRDAAGHFYVKQRAEDGEMIAIADVAQDRRRFGSWQEARSAGLKWEQAANDPRVLPVCNPQYQERRLDGVMAHLEYDPRQGTILVQDTGCKDRNELDRAGLVADAAEAVERFDEDELEAYAASR